MSYITTLLEKGQSRLNRESKERENKGIGTLRGGSGGLAFPNFTVRCQRKSLLRYQGVEIEQVSNDKLLMFAAGVANEDSWVHLLTAGLPPTARLLCEEEIPVNWTLPNGVLVTGRPDIVVVDKGKLTCGIELKLICSAWTARDIILGWPKTDHLRQAATYMWRLSEQEGYDVPFELWYSQRVNFAVGGNFMVKLFPKEGEEGSEYCKYTDKEDKQGNTYREIKDVLPFLKGWVLRWNSEGRLQVKETRSDSWEDTIITKEAIQKYYEGIIELERSDTIGVRPSNRDFKGGKESWSVCKYCPLAPVCDSVSPSEKFSEWKKKVLAFNKQET